MKGKRCLDSEYFLNAETFCLTLYKSVQRETDTTDNLTQLNVKTSYM